MLVRFRASVACSVVLLSCASTHERVPVTTEAWRYTVGAGTFQDVRGSGSAEIVALSNALIVLDVRSGKVRWRRHESAEVVAASENTVFAGKPNGSVSAFRLRDGQPLWRTKPLCGGAAYLDVDLIDIFGENALIGCRGPIAVRLDARSGAVLGRNDMLAMDRVESIAPLGECAYAISGTSSGAITLARLVIVDCKKLTTILPVQNDATVVGAVNNEAIVDDFCCNGRPDVYQPATIYRVDLKTGALSPRVDLTPEPWRYPASQRPLGQGAGAELVANALLLFVDRSAYSYGNPRHMSQPRPVMNNLRYPPQRFNGDVALAVIERNGSEEAALLRLSPAGITVLWSRPMANNGTAPAVPPNSQVVFSFYDPSGKDVFVRWPDYDSMIPSTAGNCAPQSADANAVLFLCFTSQLVGNAYVQYLSAYRWPS